MIAPVHVLQRRDVVNMGLILCWSVRLLIVCPGLLSMRN
jgi:hypothetical protein